MRIPSAVARLTLVTGILASGVLAPATGLAAVALQLDLSIGSTCVYGLKPSGGAITVKLLRADGSTRATRSDSYTGNEWNVCFASPPVIGNKLKLITDPGTGQIMHTVTIPNLTIAVDRSTNKVKGRAPAGKPIKVRYADCYPSGCDGWEVRNGMATSAGRWSKDLSSSADVDGTDALAVTYQNTHGDLFWARTVAPHMEIRYPNRVSVGCVPQGTTIVKLRRSDGTVRATKSFTSSQDCGGERGSFRRNGAPVNINVGNRVTADFASDASLTWPAMSIDGAGTTLSGRCLTNARYHVVIQDASSNAQSVGTTDGDGRFSDDLTGDWIFSSGDELDLVCETNRGDLVRRARVLP